MTDYRYASGEEPRTGDLVRVTKEIACALPLVKIGDVLTAAPAGTSDVYLFANDGKIMSGGGWFSDRFELIARAGEPVRYQPGDVVELLEDDGPERKGQRFTVSRHDQPNRGGITPRGYLYYGGNLCIRAHRCKLVHRPNKAEPLTFVPPEPQVGDRVRVTFEATMRPTVGDEVYLLDIAPQCGQLTTFDAKEIEHGNVKVEIIERAEKPLAVGDRVAAPMTMKTDVYKIAALSDEELVLEGRLDGTAEPKFHVVKRSAGWKRYEP